MNRLTMSMSAGVSSPRVVVRRSLPVNRAAPAKAACPSLLRRQRLSVSVRASEGETEVEEEKTEDQIKAEKIAELRAQEKFTTIGSGKANCQGCGYVYEPSQGDPEYPISKGTSFAALPEDWGCPTCGAPKKLFKLDEIEVAGFAANQGYGLGTNSMTEEDKSRLIYGALLFFFFLFISGYFLN